LTPIEAEIMLQRAGFKMIRSKGSHRIYEKENRKIVVPFHSGKMLHPKVVKQILRYIEET
jgi:predicted RNA binding protein YcfA (HicA-like mRNA interferase family)